MNERNEKRDADMAARFIAGERVVDIAADYRVSRARAYQLIGRGAANAVSNPARLDVLAFNRYGCSYAELFAVCAPLSPQDIRSPANAYAAQKRNAHKRGIAWEFSLPTWFAVWNKSGHWQGRGCARGKFVMSRRGDTGPYSPENVEIITHSQNVSDAAANGRTTLFGSAAA